MNVREDARRRGAEAWEARYKHARASTTWAQIAIEKPEGGAVSKALSDWMSAYADADAAAERAFREIAEKEPT